MTKGNKFGGFFGAHNTGDDGRLKHRAFLCKQFVITDLIGDLLSDVDNCCGACRPLGDLLFGNVNHPGIAGSVNVCKLLFFLLHQQELPVWSK